MISKKNLLVAIISGVLTCVTFATTTHASADGNLMSFARGIDAVVVGPVAQQVVQPWPWPLKREEVQVLFSDIVEDQFLKVLDKTILPYDDFLAHIRNEAEPLRKDTLVVYAALSFYDGTAMTPAMDRNVGALEIVYAKLDSSSPWRGSIKAFANFETHPSVFVIPDDGQAFRKLLQETLYKKLQKELVPMLCLDSPQPHGCETLRLKVETSVPQPE